MRRVLEDVERWHGCIAEPVHEDRLELAFQEVYNDHHAGERLKR